MKKSMIAVLSVLMLLTACSGGKNAFEEPAVSDSDSIEASASQTEEESQEDKQTTEESPASAAMEESEEEAAEEEADAPEEAPVEEEEAIPAVEDYPVDMENVRDRLIEWDPSLNMYSSIPLGEKKVESEYTYDEGEVLRGYYMYAYDAQGHLRVRAYYTDNGLSGYGIFEYDENGFLIRETDYTKEGEWRQQIDYVNDEKGNGIRENYIDSDGTSNNWDEYDFNEMGNPIERRGFRKGEQSFTYKYDYDMYGNQIMEERYDADGTLSYHDEFTYDIAGHQLTSLSEIPGKDSSIIEYEWSEDYHVRTNPVIGESGEQEGMRTRTYDDDGNLLESKREEQGVITYRVVYTYY